MMYTRFPSLHRGSNIAAAFITLAVVPLAHASPNAQVGDLAAAMHQARNAFVQDARTTLEKGTSNPMELSGAYDILKNENVDGLEGKFKQGLFTSAEKKEFFQNMVTETQQNKPTQYSLSQAGTDFFDWLGKNETPSVDIKDNQNKTLLHYAGQHGDEMEAHIAPVVTELIKSNVDPLAENSQNQKAAQHGAIAFYGVLYYVKQKNYEKAGEVVQAFSQGKQDHFIPAKYSNQKNPDAREGTLLNHAAYTGDINCADYLIAQHKYPNELTENAILSPLGAAMLAGHVEMVQHLIAHKADIIQTGRQAKDSKLTATQTLQSLKKKRGAQQNEKRISSILQATECIASKDDAATCAKKLGDQNLTKEDKMAVVIHWRHQYDNKKVQSQRYHDVLEKAFENVQANALKGLIRLSCDKNPETGITQGKENKIEDYEIGYMAQILIKQKPESAFYQESIKEFPTSDPDNANKIDALGKDIQNTTKFHPFFAYIKERIETLAKSVNMTLEAMKSS